MQTRQMSVLVGASHSGREWIGRFAEVEETARKGQVDAEVPHQVSLRAGLLVTSSDLGGSFAAGPVPQCHMGGTGLLTWGRLRHHPFSRNGSLSLPWSLSLQGERGRALVLILEPWGWSDGVKWNPCRHLD